jgi:hypothetical protein
MQSKTSVFQSHIQEIEKENNSVVEVLISIHDILVERQTQNFMSLKVKSFIEEKRRGLHVDCDKFCAEVTCLYESYTRIFQEMDAANGRILFHVDGTE